MHFLGNRESGCVELRHNCRIVKSVVNDVVLVMPRLGSSIQPIATMAMAASSVPTNQMRCDTERRRRYDIASFLMLLVALWADGPSIQGIPCVEGPPLDVLCCSRRKMTGRVT